MKTTLEERIRQREEKIAKEKARLQKDTARQKAINQKLETRRKILLGQTLLSAIKEDADLRSRVGDVLRKSLEPEDLKLFDTLI